MIGFGDSHDDFDKRFRKRERVAKSIIGFALLSQIVMFVLLIVGFSILISRCNRNMEKNGTTFIEQVGKQAKEVKEEFNKGYASDTLVVDTLQVK